MRKYKKEQFDPANVRRLLEPPRTPHWQGDGEYMISGREIATRQRFPKPSR